MDIIPKKKKGFPFQLTEICISLFRGYTLCWVSFEKKNNCADFDFMFPKCKRKRQVPGLWQENAHSLSVPLPFQLFLWATGWACRNP